MQASLKIRGKFTRKSNGLLWSVFLGGQCALWALKLPTHKFYLAVFVSQTVPKLVLNAFCFCFNNLFTFNFYVNWQIFVKIWKLGRSTLQLLLLSLKSEQNLYLLISNYTERFFLTLVNQNNKGIRSCNCNIKRYLKLLGPYKKAFTLSSRNA